MLSKDKKSLVMVDKPCTKMFCPMANDGKGAIWISEPQDIKNPYLGKAMPTCGTIKEEMK